MATSRILLITNVGDTAVADALRTGGHEVTAVASLEAGVAAAGTGADHEVVILDLTGPVQAMVDGCGAFRRDAGLNGLPILCVSPTDDVEDRIHLLEAGADDVIARPFDARELDARTEALALRLQRTRDLTIGDSAGPEIRDAGGRRTIAVFSPKGGVGTTTVAVNVATWLAGRVAGGVAILDLDFQFGQVATHLNMTPRLTMVDLVRDELALRDPGLFQSSLDRHGSGLMVLGAPSTPDAAAGVSDEAVAAAVGTASAAYQVVVVDAGSVLDARSESIITRATDLVIVVTPEFPALKAVHALAELLGGSGMQLGETTYVLNEIFARELLRPRDIEEALETKIGMTIPYDSFAFLKSVNEGVPVVEASPRSAAAQQLGRLAAQLGGLPVDTAPAERKSKGFGGLFGR